MNLTWKKIMKKMNKKSADGIHYCLSVASDIKNVLSNVLIDYLWQLVLCEDWKNYEQQLFILQVEELSGRGVQDIYHVLDCGNPMEGYRVYGAEPVNCTIQVTQSNGFYDMKLYGTV